MGVCVLCVLTRIHKYVFTLTAACLLTIARCEHLVVPWSYYWRGVYKPHFQIRNTQTRRKGTRTQTRDDIIEHQTHTNNTPTRNRCTAQHTNINSTPTFRTQTARRDTRHNTSHTKFINESVRTAPASQASQASKWTQHNIIALRCCCT